MFEWGPRVNELEGHMQTRLCMLCPELDRTPEVIEHWNSKDSVMF